MIIILLFKYIYSFLLATIIQGFSTRLGFFILIPKITILNFIYTCFANLIITYIATLFFWEIFRIFENNQIMTYCKLFPNFISLDTNSIIPPGFLLDWNFISIRMFSALFLTGLMELNYLVIQYYNPYIAENFILIFTNLTSFLNMFLFFVYDWGIEPLLENSSDEESLTPPRPYEEIKQAAEEKLKLNNALVEQKKTLIRGLFSMQIIILISVFALCDTIYGYYPFF